jgi:NAD(P)-dependent dehydrogenase (short-subunit alcohol dehydrogenase family)
MTPSPGDLAPLLSLDGRTALVTGGSGGIGSAVVRLFQRAGATVVSVDRADRAAPEHAVSIPCDLADAAAIAAMMEGLGKRFGRLDLLVHCAGITRDAVVWKMAPGDWEDVMRVNLDAAFHLLRGAVPLLRAAADAGVIFVTSINGERGKFGQANYSASKAGLIGLGRTAARELGAFGIRVNMIAPGMIETDLIGRLPEDVRQRARGRRARALGRPDDVARVALFWHRRSRGMTGQVLRVDGGQLIS